MLILLTAIGGMSLSQNHPLKHGQIEVEGTIYDVTISPEYNHTYVEEASLHDKTRILINPELGVGNIYIRQHGQATGNKETVLPSGYPCGHPGHHHQGRRVHGTGLYSAQVAHDHRGTVQRIGRTGSQTSEDIGCLPERMGQGPKIQRVCYEISEVGIVANELYSSLFSSRGWLLVSMLDG